MAFGNITTVYLPLAANAGSSLWGTLVYKVLGSAEATNDATTITSHSTGANVTRTEKPYTTSTVDDTESTWGWAIQPSDMSSVTGDRRFMAAGNHVASCFISNTGSVGKNGCILTMFAYRVAPAAGRARTLLGSASSASFNTPNLSASIAVTITLALGQVIFENDETIQYSFELNAPGTAVVGESYIFYTGFGCQIAFPTLGHYFTQTNAVTGVGTIAPIVLTSMITAAVTGVGTVTQAELVSALVTAGVTGVGTVTQRLTATLPTIPVVGIGTIAGRANIALGDIPTGGGGTTITQIIAVIE